MAATRRQLAVYLGLGEETADERHRRKQASPPSVSRITLVAILGGAVAGALWGVAATGTELGATVFGLVMGGFLLGEGLLRRRRAVAAERAKARPADPVRSAPPR